MKLRNTISPTCSEVSLVNYGKMCYLLSVIKVLQLGSAKNTEPKSIQPHHMNNKSIAIIAILEY